MAVAGIIAAAVGVMLLIVVGYVVVGATITTAETVTNAQKDVTLQNEMRLGTAIVITDPQQSSSNITSNVTNTGTEIISDFRHMDVIVYDTGSNEYQVCTYDASGNPVPGVLPTVTRISSILLNLTRGKIPDTGSHERIFTFLVPDHYKQRGLCFSVCLT